jgi:hypothetical protein
MLGTVRRLPTLRRRSHLPLALPPHGCPGRCISTYSITANGTPQPASMQCCSSARRFRHGRARSRTKSVGSFVDPLRDHLAVRSRLRLLGAVADAGRRLPPDWASLRALLLARGVHLGARLLLAQEHRGCLRCRFATQLAVDLHPLPWTRDLRRRKAVIEAERSEVVMGRAEDAVRRRMRAEQDSKDAVKRAAENRAAQLRLEIGPEVRAALVRLEAKGFPGAELFTERRFFGRTTEHAYWNLRAGTSFIIDSNVQDFVMLFSDGTIASTGLSSYGKRLQGNPIEYLGVAALRQLLSALQSLGT